MPIPLQNPTQTSSISRATGLGSPIAQASPPVTTRRTQAQYPKLTTMSRLPPGRNNFAPPSQPTHLHAAVSAAYAPAEPTPVYQDDPHWADVEVRSEYNKKFHHAQPSPAEQHRARDYDMRKTLYSSESNQAVPAGMVPTAHLDVFRNPHFAQQMRNRQRGAEPIFEFTIRLPNGEEVGRSRSEVEMHVMIERVIERNLYAGTRQISSHAIQIGGSDASSAANSLQTDSVTSATALQEAASGAEYGDFADDHQSSVSLRSPSLRSTSGLAGEELVKEQAEVDTTSQVAHSEYFSAREDASSSRGKAFSACGDFDDTTSAITNALHVPTPEPGLTASPYEEVTGSCASSRSDLHEAVEQAEAEGSGEFTQQSSGPQRKPARASSFKDYLSDASSTSSQARETAASSGSLQLSPDLDLADSDQDSCSSISFRPTRTVADAHLHSAESNSAKTASLRQKLTEENLAIAARLAGNAAPTVASGDFGKDCWNAAANETSETDLALSAFICDLAAQHSGAASPREHFVSAAATSAAEFLEANLTDGTEETETIDTPPENWEGWPHWLDNHNLQLCENYGNGGTNARMNCLLHAIIQHASGDYAPENPTHIHFAELLRAGLIAHTLSEPPQANGDNQMLFADGAALNWALPLINQAYGTDLQVLTFYAGRDQAGNIRPLKGTDSLRFGESSSGKQKVALLFQDNHFVGLIGATSINSPPAT